jgi:hypothetical protein
MVQSNGERVLSRVKVRGGATARGTANGGGARGGSRVPGRLRRMPGDTI